MRCFSSNIGLIRHNGSDTQMRAMKVIGSAMGNNLYNGQMVNPITAVAVKIALF